MFLLPWRRDSGTETQISGVRMIDNRESTPRAYNLKMDSRPSSLNILRKFYIRVTRLDEYVKGQVSENRYARLLSTAQEHDAMKKLIQTAYVCLNPKLQILDDDDGLGGPSVLSIGDHATQNEVELAIIVCLW